MRAADAVVTTGCGDACPIYPDRRYLDWDIEDPVDLPLAHVRDIRDDIDARVRQLLTTLAMASPSIVIGFYPQTPGTTMLGTPAATRHLHPQCTPALQEEDGQWGGASYSPGTAGIEGEYPTVRRCMGNANSPTRRRRSGGSRVLLLAADAAVGAACVATASFATVVHRRLFPHPLSAGDLFAAARDCAGVISTGCRVVHGENNLGERPDSACEVRISDLVASLSTFGNGDDEAAAAQTGEVIGDIGSRQLESLGKPGRIAR